MSRLKHEGDIDRLQFQFALRDTQELGPAGRLLGRNIGIGVEMIREHDEVRARRPGKVVHPGLNEVGRDRVALDCLLDQTAGGADFARVVGRETQADIPIAEIGEELAVGVKLVDVPARFGSTAVAGVLEDADLWKPLSTENEIAVATGAGKNPRHLGRELDVELDPLTWLHRLRQRIAGDGAVLLIPIVRLDEFFHQLEVRPVVEIDRLRLTRHAG